MSLNLIFQISDFHNLKIVNNIFLFVLEGSLSFFSRGIYIYIYTYINGINKESDNVEKKRKSMLSKVKNLI